MLYRVHLALVRLELTTLVVIGTDCIGSWKSNYHAIRPQQSLYIMYLSLSTEIAHFVLIWQKNMATMGILFCFRLIEALKVFFSDTTGPKEFLTSTNDVKLYVGLLYKDFSFCLDLAKNLTTMSNFGFWLDATLKSSLRLQDHMVCYVVQLCITCEALYKYYTFNLVLV